MSQIKIKTAARKMIDDCFAKWLPARTEPTDNVAKEKFNDLCFSLSCENLPATK